jgi:hypothetical protein
MLADRRQRARRWLRIAHLVLLLLLAAFGRLHHLRCAALVRGVVQKSADIMDEERVQQLRDLLFVCEVECPFKGNPERALVLANDHKHD